MGIMACKQNKCCNHQQSSNTNDDNDITNIADKLRGRWEKKYNCTNFLIFHNRESISIIKNLKVN